MSEMDAMSFNKFLQEKAGVKVQRGNKYHAARVTVDGIVFDSKKESAYWLKLKAMEKSGKISGLQRQVRFTLQDGFRDNEGKWNKAIIYIADFVYNEGGKEVVVDVKSRITEANQVYRIKRKMFKFRYPNMIFREIVT